MKIETSLSTQLSQQMRLAPQVIQSIEILQLPIMALVEHVQQELTDNHVLEEVVEPEKNSQDSAQEAENSTNKED